MNALAAIILFVISGWYVWVLLAILVLFITMIFGIKWVASWLGIILIAFCVGAGLGVYDAIKKIGINDCFFDFPVFSRPI